MAAPRPSPAISVSVSAPAFYAPQKKFAPVVAPKPKVNPFRPGDGEPGAQRAQIGRVGDVPPPPPEGKATGEVGEGGRGARARVLGKGCREYGGPGIPSRADVLTSSWSSWARSKFSAAWGGGSRNLRRVSASPGSVFPCVTGAAALLGAVPAFPDTLSPSPCPLSLTLWEPPALESCEVRVRVVATAGWVGACGGDLELEATSI